MNLKSIFVLLVIASSVLAEETKVMTFNIRYDARADKGTRDWGHRLPIIAPEFKKASIIGSQEALHHQVKQLLEKLPNYAYVGHGRNDGEFSGEFAPIFYDKTQWKVLESSTFWLSDTPEVVGSKHWGNGITRICTWAHMENKSGAKLYVFNAHFDHRSQQSREKSAELILKTIQLRKHAEDPVVLLGDFNATISNKAIKSLTEAVDEENKAVLVDSYLSTNPENKNPATFNRWKADYKGVGKIDFIFHSPEIETLSSVVLNPVVNGAVASDHMPQLSVIKWDTKK